MKDFKKRMKKTSEGSSLLKENNWRNDVERWKSRGRKRLKKQRERE